VASPTLTQSVQEVWAAVTPALPTLYLGEVPEDQASFLPTAVLIHKGEVPTYNTALQTPQQLKGEFDVIVNQAGGVAPLEVVTLAVMAALKPDSLHLTGNQTVTLFRTNYVLAATKQRDKNGGPVYRGTISYRALVGGPTV
jgi:hypothetical protein